MKLTKKELEEIKEEIRTKKIYRKLILKQCDNYIKDVEALKRVYKMNNEEDKLGYYGELKADEDEKVLANYPEYNKLDNKMKCLVGQLARGMKDFNSEYDILTTNTYRYDGNITLWEEKDVINLIDLLNRLGYTTLEYANNSSIAMQDIHYITKNSKFKLVGSSIKEDDNWGKPVLIFKRDLEQERLEEKEKEAKNENNL